MAANGRGKAPHRARGAPACKPRAATHQASPDFPPRHPQYKATAKEYLNKASELATKYGSQASDVAKVRLQAMTAEGLQLPTRHAHRA